MPRRFVDLDIEEISSVTHPANKRRYLVIKAAHEDDSAQTTKNDEHDSMPMTTEQRLHHREWYALWDAFTGSMYEFMEAMVNDPVAYAPAMIQSIEQFLDHARDLLAQVGMVEKAEPLLVMCEEVCKEGRVMSSERLRRLKDAITMLQAMLDEAMPIEKRRGTVMAETAELDTLRKRVTELEASQVVLQSANDTLTADLAKARMTPEEHEAAYLQGLPDVVRKQFEADKLEKAELRKLLQEAEDRHTRQEYIAKAASYKALPVKPDDDWEVFKAMSALEPRHRERIEQLFKAAEELATQGKIFQAIGTGGSGSGAEQGAYAKIEKLAQAKLDAGDVKTLAQGIDRVTQEQPALYAAYKASQREQR